MDSQHPSSTKVVSNPGKKLLIVGPEGGFSPSESQWLHQIKNVRVLQLPTGILRTPTAVATGAGIILESLLD
jgi:RsmE family RNA methyltransferase